jgi:hypothetical protein
MPRRIAAGESWLASVLTINTIGYADIVVRTGVFSHIYTHTYNMMSLSQVRDRLIYSWTIFPWLFLD